HKGQEILVPLIAKLRATGVLAELSVTLDRRDDSQVFDNVVRAAEAEGVAQHINITGRTSAVHSLYQRADALIFSSYTESFGFPVLEAMASGLPIIASSIPATVELAGASPWYFTAGDPHSALRAVTDFLGCSDETLRQRLSAGRARAAVHSWARNADEVAAAIDEVI